MEGSTLDDLGLLAKFAKIVGSSEGIVRLMIALLAGYPLALLQRRVFHGKNSNVQHLFFILSGVSLGYFCFGFEVFHSVINILIVYALLVTLRGNTLCVASAFLINLVYLCIGYYYVSTVEYTIKWTIPHCVLTLRLTGLVFDVFDGRKKEEARSAEQKETALAKIPSLLEIAGHSFFFGGYLVGPQFPMTRYLEFVQGKFSDKVTGGPPASVTYGLSRLAGGITYLTLYQITSIFLPDSYLLSDTFMGSGLLMKMVIITVWGKLLLYRYVGVWLLTEGACVMTGLTHNGKDENGNDLWNGCANVHVREFEFSPSCQGLINSFNVNTNKWMAKYVYKRLKFMGNRYISQFVTLMYLAIWHGILSGYFVNFSFEFFVMKFEREIGPLLSQLGAVKLISSIPGGHLLLWFWKKCISHFLCSYALVSFCLLSYDLYLPVYSSVFFLGHLVCVGWIPLYPYAKKMLRGSKKDSNAAADTRAKAE